MFGSYIDWKNIIFWRKGPIKGSQLDSLVLEIMTHEINHKTKRGKLVLKSIKMHTTNAYTLENLSKSKPTCNKPTTSTPLRNLLNENENQITD